MRHALALLAVLFTPLAALAAPSISSLSPNSGPIGTSVTIAGSNFGSTQGSSTVKFGNTTATTITSWNATQIVVVVPTGTSSGNVSVVVRVSNSNSNGVTFTVLVPTITSLTPNSGAVGASVTVAGSNFGSSQGTSTIKFNNVAATVTNWSATSIVATVPSTTTGNVLINVSGVNSNTSSFTVLPTPTVTSITPNSAAGGAAVTIAGTNFGSSQGSSTVKFANNVNATVTSWSASSIGVTVPAGAVSGNVTVNVAGLSPSKPFTVLATPTITSLSSTSGAVSASVTINGTNFGTTQGSVKFGSTTASVTSWNTTAIVTAVPSGASTGNIVVGVSGLNLTGPLFTVVPAPNLTSVTPNSGAIGAVVTVSGTNFGASQGSSTVKFFNGKTASVITWSATSVKVAVPSGATTGNLQMYASGVNSNTANFTVTAVPVITSLVPQSGAIGTLVTISGANFGNTAASNSVRFGTKTAKISVWNNTTIVASVPAGADGPVLVRAAGVGSNTLPFTPYSALLKVEGSGQTASGNYIADVTAMFLRPTPNSSAPHGLEAQLAWFHTDGTLFALDRFTLADAAVPDSGVHDSVVTNVPPPWRIEVRVREKLGQVPANSPFYTCNSDKPYPGQLPCAAGDQNYSSGGTVLLEQTGQITVTNLGP
jgi:IPT/TIG domain